MKNLQELRIELNNRYKTKQITRQQYDEEFEKLRALWKAEQPPKRNIDLGQLMETLRAANIGKPAILWVNLGYMPKKGETPVEHSGTIGLNYGDVYTANQVEQFKKVRMTRSLVSIIEKNLGKYL